MPDTTLAAPERHGKTRLYTVINDDVYKLRLIKRDTWKVSHNGDPTRAYTTGRPNRGPMACTCPDHRIRGTTCKHLGALLALGLISRPRRKGASNA